MNEVKHAGRRTLLLSVISVLMLSTVMMAHGGEPEHTVTTRGEGTVYYVDSAWGNDHYDGKSDKTAFRSIMKLNNMDFQPGDVIKFRNGTEYEIDKVDGGLDIDESGEPGRQIVFETYDVGHKPIIDGGNIAESCISISGDFIIVRDLDLINSGSNGIIISSSYVDIENVDVSEAGNNGIVHVGGGSYIRVGNCSVRDVRNTGIGYQGSQRYKVSNTITEYCTVTRSGNDGISIHKNQRGDDAGSDHIIKHCVSFNNPEEGFDIQSGNDVLVEYCESYGNGRGSFILSPSVDCIVRYSYFHDSNGSTEVSIVGCSYLWMYNNIIKAGTGDQMMRLIIISDENGEIDNVYLYSNIFLVTEGGKFSERVIWVDDMDDSGGVGSINILNNIVVSHRPFYYFRNKDLGSTDVRIDWNCYHSLDGDFRVGENTFPMWQENYGYDLNGIEADPLLHHGQDLVDFWLEEESPCIDIGYDFDIPYDLFGNPRRGLPDLGPLEYQPVRDMDNDPMLKDRDFRLYSDGKFRYMNEENSTLINFTVVPDVNWFTDENGRTGQLMDITNVSRVRKDYEITWKEEAHRTDLTYSYHIGGFHKNVYFTVTVNDEFKLHVLSNAKGYVKFSMNDSSRIREVRAVLFEGPLIIDDRTEKIGTTGDRLDVIIYTYYMFDFDDILVRYCMDGPDDLNGSMTRFDHYNYITGWIFPIDVPMEDCRKIDYIIEIRYFSKVLRSDERTVLVYDNDAPEIVSMNVSETWTIQDRFLLNMTLYDNSGEFDVAVEYWMNDGEHEVHSERVIDDYLFEFLFDEPETGELFYFLTLTDRFNNTFVSDIYSVNIIDVRKPSVVSMVSIEAASNGEMIDFTLTASDDVGISSIVLELRYEGMVKLFAVNGTDSFLHRFSVPEDLTADISYRYVISDASGNTLITNTSTIGIYDGLKPELIDEFRDGKARYGKDYLIIIEADDNIGVSNVTLEYWFDDGKHTFKPMSPTREYHTSTVDINRRGVLHFRYILEDVNGNVNITGTRDVEVVDEGISFMVLLVSSAVVLMVIGAVVLAVIIGRKDEDVLDDPPEEDIMPVEEPVIAETDEDMDIPNDEDDLGMDDPPSLEGDLMIGEEIDAEEEAMVDER